MRALLDVNVLIALLDAGHVHHQRATQWLQREIANGWATCPLTQNGCIRILSQPSYLNNAPVRLVAQILGDAVASPRHEFWPDSLSLLAPDILNWERLLTGRHLTDLYLLALAVHHRGCLVTLDRRIPIDTVPGAMPEHLVILSNDV